VGRNVAAVMGAQVGEPQPFRYKTRGVFVDMGRQRAVAQTMGIKWSGFPAFLLARAYYISEIPGLGRKLRLLTDWTVGMLFGRDSSELGQIGRARSLSQEMEAAETPEGEKKGEGESGGAEAVDGARESDEAGGNGAQVAGSRSAG
jgi:NADH dehydrogenase